ncbi:LOW QUALITY PROTEIN: hypothetical protein U9M48_014158, partial [Paspalum notatum var. saurae]
MVHLSRTFGCQIGSLPFTYLGLPLGTTKPRITDFTPILGRVERRLSACSVYLSYSGHLQMINSVITPITTYAMSTFKLQICLIEQIDQARKQCLWRGSDANNKGGNLVAWPVVLRPKDKGGLGVIDLNIQNDGLLLKQLHKFYSRKDTPWVHLIWDKYYQGCVPHEGRKVGSFWWKDIQRLFRQYRNLAKSKVGDGASTLCWEDLWLDSPVKVLFPSLASFAFDLTSSIKDINEAKDLEIDHLNTRSMLHRRNLIQQQDRACSITGSAETIEHLFFDCAFARQCWHKLHLVWGDNPIIQDRILQAIQQNNLPFALEIIVIAMWELWKITNRKIFDNQEATINLWVFRFKEEVFTQS